MKKELLRNQSGFSLLMTLFVAGVIGSGVYYGMQVSELNKKTASKARAATAIEAEKKRIATILSDSANCTANFGGQPYTQASIASLHYKTPAVDFVTAGVVQPDSRLKLINISLSFTPGSPKSGVLMLKYYNNSTDISRVSSGLAGRIVTIPLYMSLDASNNVASCYAITENEKVSDGIEAACQSSPTDYSYFNTTYGVTNSCSTNFTLDQMGTTPTAYTDCSANPGQALRGFDIETQSSPNTGNTIKIPTTKCAGFTSGTATDVTCPQISGYGQRSYGVSNGIIQCDYPGNNHETPTTCPAGQMVNKTSSTTASCYNANCTSPAFVNSILDTGVVCFTPATYTCPANQWARGFNASGTPDCAPFPSMNGTCTGGFGVSISRNVSTYDGTLNCAAYTIAKPCPSPPYYFMTAFTSGNPTCVPY